MKHKEFILKPMSTILEEAIVSCKGVGDGIETNSLFDYVMQSIFLKMTGYQEQKGKCILWEIATNDFEYRRKFLDSKLGELSTYNDKNNVYKVLRAQIKKHNSSFRTDILKNEIFKNSFDYVAEVFKETNLMKWKERMYHDFTHLNIIKNNHFLMNENEMFHEILKKEYGILYAQRNRLAHNTLSYQQNLPNFDILKSQKGSEQNYFFWFAILILIDNIYIELFKEYIKVLESDIYY